MIGRWSRLAVSASFACLLGAASAHAQTLPGYLGGHLPAYMPPPAPTDPAVVEIDMVQVRAERPSPTSARWLEAYADARSYYAQDIIRRFDDATGEILYQQQRPLLNAVLQRVIADTSAYAAKAKSANPRPRPYVEDPSIVPCNKDFLKDQESYPSGHAMNGYVVSKVLAAVFPAQGEQILARGLRYGDNRVVCGVHHPSDIEQGRLLGVAYLSALTVDPAFQADLDCAKQEEASLGPDKTPMSAVCAQKRQAIVKAATPAALTLQHAAAGLF